MSYWGSSALVKLYSKETDSSVFEQFASNAQTTARLALYEIQTTLRRKEAEGTLTAGAAQVNHQRLMQDAADGQIRIVEFSLDIEREFQDVLIRCFQQLPPVFIRTLDAIHLASAMLRAKGSSSARTSDCVM